MNVLITGASRGIGKALSEKLSDSGIKRLFLVSRDEQALNHLKQKISKINPDVKLWVLPYDITENQSIKKIRDVVESEAGLLDILINNAGAIVVKEFRDFTPEDVELQFKVNYFAPSRLISVCIPLLMKAENSHVINISSMSGYQGSKKFPGLSHYGASKAALAALTESLAEEYRGKISFNALCLGAVQTEMLEEAFPGYKAPLEPWEMAGFIADFALNAHRVMNGKIIPVSLVDP